MTTAASSFFQTLFEPVPEAPSTQNKDFMDHVAHYANTTEGAWDIFRVIDHVLSYVQKLPSIAQQPLGTLGKVREVASAAGLGLSIPQTISCANSLRRSVTRFINAQDLPYNDPLRVRKVWQAFKDTFLDSIGLGFLVSQAVLFVDSVKLFALNARQLVVVNAINNATALVWDGAELVEESFKLSKFYSPQSQPRTAADSAKLGERKTLSWLIIAKDVASVGGSAIALVGIALGIAMEGAILTPVLIALGTTWLTMKLISYFYNKTVVEATPTRQLTV